MLVGRLFGGKTTGEDGSPSLKERFVAWWRSNGFDQPLFIKGADPPRITSAPSAGTTATTAPPPVATADGWSPTRLRVAESIWGSGFNFPGGTDYVLELVKPFALTPQKSMLDMGSGLGGATRAIAKHFNAWVSGLEASPSVAAAGMEASERLGLGKRAPIAGFDPDTVELPEKKYDCVFVRQVLCPVANKARLIEQLRRTLKPNGQVLITEYVVREPGLDTPSLEAWRRGEDQLPQPWTIDELRRAIAACKFDVRVAEDVTEEFQHQVRQGWANVAKSLSGGGLAPEDAQALVREVELWARRVAALESGDLRLARIFAIRQG